MDESNVLDSGFLERMNTLLANGEVPGLFEGDEYITLCTQIKVGAGRRWDRLIEARLSAAIFVEMCDAAISSTARTGHVPRKAPRRLVMQLWDEVD